MVRIAAGETMTGAIRERMRGLAAEHRRFGFRRLHWLLGREGVRIIASEPGMLAPRTVPHRVHCAPPFAKAPTMPDFRLISAPSCGPLPVPEPSLPGGFAAAVVDDQAGFGRQLGDVDRLRASQAKARR